ncbi:unnamed protein product [Soboliphyme baturini]|uniref:Triple QxxK/R motif-containing protein n=1 Tax=Soboliphyme baturini TaxID=241478 RepID=A0A183J799_9BILA|nr:unnamed protein product [Soboliphyme baturini]
MDKSSDESSDGRHSEEKSSHGEQEDDIPDVANAGPAPFKLDKKHGFLKSIIRNQIDRDQYDKYVKAQQEKRRNFKISTPKPKRPEVPLYVPPCRKTSEGTVKTKVLFNFEVEDETGMIHSIPIKQVLVAGALIELRV